MANNNTPKQSSSQLIQAGMAIVAAASEFESSLLNWIKGILAACDTRSMLWEIIDGIIKLIKEACKDKDTANYEDLKTERWAPKYRTRALYDAYNVCRLAYESADTLAFARRYIAVASAIWECRLLSDILQTFSKKGSHALDADFLKKDRASIMATIDKCRATDEGKSSNWKTNALVFENMDTTRFMESLDMGQYQEKVQRAAATTTPLSEILAEVGKAAWWLVPDKGSMDNILAVLGLCYIDDNELVDLMDYCEERLSKVVKGGKNAFAILSSKKLVRKPEQSWSTAHKDDVEPAVEVEE